MKCTEVLCSTSMQCRPAVLWCVNFALLTAAWLKAYSRPVDDAGQDSDACCTERKSEPESKGLSTRAD